MKRRECRECGEPCRPRKFLCAACRRVNDLESRVFASRRYRAKHRAGLVERNRANRRNWKARHHGTERYRTMKLAQRARWRARNRERLRAIDAAYREKNRQAVRERSRIANAKYRAKLGAEEMRRRYRMREARRPKRNRNGKRRLLLVEVRGYG